MAAAAIPRDAQAAEWWNAMASAAGRPPDLLAHDEDVWTQVAQAYDLDGRHVVLNGGGNNPQPRAITEALARYDRLAASQPRPHNVALLARFDDLRARLARHLNCDAEEVAITRNTTEGLNIVAHGLPLQAGDEVLISRFDEHYAGASWLPRVTRENIRIVRVDLPLAPSVEEVIARFSAAITPRTRLLVASHLVDGWGFVLPIRELSELAHRHGAQLLADGALSFGQMPVDVRALGCDYYATSLHKWLSAPLGTGALYVRRDRIASLWPLYGNRVARDDIRKFEAIGTRSGPTVAAIGEALDFHERIGPERKLARVRHLLGVLLDALAGAPKVRVYTEPDPARRAGLARVCIDGASGRDLMLAVREHGFYTFGGFDDAPDGVYVSPNLFNTPAQLQRFAEVVRQLSRNGVPLARTV